MTSRPDLQRFRDATIDDVLGPDLRLLFVGINPSLWSAATNAHFARPGNRFWPALHLAGITQHLVECRGGMSDADRAYVQARGIGITNLVARATVRADELGPAELRDGAHRIERLVAERGPAVVAFAGITTYRAAFGRRDARAGEQAEPLAGARVWVVPNPSGLNAHESVASLAAAYREAALAAGIEPAR